MTTMDYFYSPQTQSVVEYYDNYICPVPDAKQELLHPTGWNKTVLNVSPARDRAADVDDRELP